MGANAAIWGCQAIASPRCASAQRRRRHHPSRYRNLQLRARSARSGADITDVPTRQRSEQPLVRG
eukprot:3520874-Rhodomonas_salina.1